MSSTSTKVNRAFTAINAQEQAAHLEEMHRRLANLTSCNDEVLSWPTINTTVENIRKAVDELFSPIAKQCPRTANHLKRYAEAQATASEVISQFAAEKEGRTPPSRTLGQLFGCYVRLRREIRHHHTKNLSQSGDLYGDAVESFRNL
ncbi:MAG: hypothetical protein AAF191_09290 [Verrucomicrobiota bacterium]